MNEAAAIPSAVPPSTPSRPKDTAVGASVLLAALAVGFALWALWLIDSTYARYQERTNLDVPDWIAINMDLTFKVIPLGLAGGLCLLVSGSLFLAWASQAGWVMRVGFAVQWLVSGAIVGFVVVSRLS